MTERAPLTVLTTAVAFALGAVVATTATWLVADAGAEGQDAGTIHVCVATGGVLRVVPSGRACESGQKPLSLLDAGAPPADSSPAERDALERTLHDLERQAADLMRLGRHDGASTVTAPFEVLDRRDHVVFSVVSDQYRGTYVTKFGAGKASASLAAFDSVGYLAVQSASGNEPVSIGHLGDPSTSFGLQMGEQDTGVGLELGRGVYGRTADIYMLSVGRAMIGQSKVGSGLMYVADQNGDIRSRAWASTESGGTVDILNGSEQRVASLEQGTHGGMLLLTNSTGERMVDAGVESGGYGVVRAGPASFKLGLGPFGLPGSYILGKPK
jgi:hypothetical protein